MDETRSHVLVAVGDKATRKRLLAELEEPQSFALSEARDCQTMLALLEQAQWKTGIVIVDDTLRQEQGAVQPIPCASVITQIRARHDGVEAIAILDKESGESLNVLQAGASCYLWKPVNAAEVGILVGTLFERMSPRATLFERKALDQIIDTSASLHNGRTLPDVLQTILHGVQTIGYDRVRLYLMSQDGRKLVGEAQEGLADDFIGLELSLEGDEYIQRILESSQPVIFRRGKDTTPWPYERELSKEDVTEWVGVRIAVRDHVMGAITADNKFSRRIILEKEMGALSIFASQAAIAIENVRLFVQEKRASEEAKWRARTLELLSRAGNEILGELGNVSLEEILNLVARHAAEILEAEASGIFLVERSGYLCLQAGHGHSAFEKGMELAIRSERRGGLTGHIANQGEMFNACGGELANHFAVKGLKPHTVSGHCNSLLAIPLKRRTSSGEELIGLLRVDNKRDADGKIGPENCFSKDDEWALRLFADLVVTAVESARLVSEQAGQKDYQGRLLASVPDGVIAIDNQARVTTFNDKAQIMLGYQPDEVVGRKVTHLYVDPEEPNRIGRELDLTIDGKLSGYETSVRSRTGEKIPIELSATWLYDADGLRVGSVGFFKDLRIVKGFEKRMRLLLEAANVVSQATNLENGLDDLAEMLCSLLRTKFCFVFLVDSDNEYLEVMSACVKEDGAIRHDHPLAVERHTRLEEWPALSELLENGGLSQFGHDGYDPRTVRTWSRRLGFDEDIRSLLLIPLRTRDQAVGVICLGNTHSWKEVALSKESSNLIVAMADQTAALVERIRLHEETERRERLLRTLAEASQHIRAEKETTKLLQEVVRLAAQLVGFRVGGLFTHHRQLGMLQLAAAHNLPAELIESSLPYGDEVFGTVARTGMPECANDYSLPAQELKRGRTFFRTLIAVPLKEAGEVDAILFVADESKRIPVLDEDTEILERFATQASLALRTSRLMGEEQRQFSQLAILHKISEYVQAADDLGKILHVLLTGITAGYGLGFNRAALFLRDERAGHLEGRVGIGHLDEVMARASWTRDHQKGLFDLSRYLDLVDLGDLPLTPVNEGIRGLRIPLQPSEPDAFSRVVFGQQHLVLDAEELESLPESFVEAFEPAAPLAIVPLKVRDEVIGLLVVDNKFTRSPITVADIDSLFTFANTAAVAIHNRRLFQDVTSAREMLRSTFEASNTLVSPEQPHKVLEKIVRQARVSADAAWVSLILIDKGGEARNLFLAGIKIGKGFDIQDVLRPDGVTMEVMSTGKAVAIEDTELERERVNPMMFRENVRAALCLPLSLQGKQLGVMWIHYNEPRFFPEHELEAIQMYVNQAAIAIDSARRVKELELIRHATEALTRAESLPEVTTEIARGAREVLGADSAAFWFYDDEQGVVVPKRSASVGIRDDLWQSHLESEARHDVTTGTHFEDWFHIEDVEGKHDEGALQTSVRDLLRHAGVKSLQGLTLTLGNERLGVLCANYTRKRVFGREDRKLALSFANDAAFALKKAVLLDQVHRAYERAGIVARVMTLGDLDETLQSIADGVKDVLGCDAITIYVYDPEKRKLRYPPTVAGLRYPSRVQRLPHVEPGSIILDMLNRENMYIVDDVTQDPRFENRRFVVDEEIASCIAVPLRMGSQKVGVMFVNYRSARSFIVEELKELELLANQAVVSIHNALLYERSQRRTNALRALYDAGQVIASARDLSATLQSTAEQAWKLCGVDGPAARISCLFLLKADELKIGAVHPPGHIDEMRQNLDANRMDDGGHIQLIRQAMDTRKPILAGDLSGADWSEGQNLKSRSRLAVPLQYEDRVIGAIFVAHPEPAAFDKGDEAALVALGAQASVAIQKALALGEITILSEVVASLSGSVDSSEVLTHVLKAAMELTETDSGSILPWNAEQERFEEAYTARKRGSQVELERYTTSARSKDGVARNVVDMKKPVVIPDTEKDERVSEVAIKKGRRALMGVPLLRGSSVVAVLFVSDTSPKHFTPSQITLLETLANDASIVLDRMSRHEELRRTKGLVGAATAVAWMGMASTTWRHAIEGHAITIRDEAELVRRSLKRSKKLSKGVSSRLGKIRDQVEKILERPITPPLSDEEGLHSVSVNELVEERISQLRQNPKYSHMRYSLELNEPASVRASPEWLQRVVDILVDNALIATEDAEERRLTISNRVAPDSVEIAFRDTGHGISEEVMAKLGKEQIRGSAGLGMGILMAMTILQTYGGDLYVSSPGPFDTTIVFRLPLERQKQPG